MGGEGKGSTIELLVLMRGRDEAAVEAEEAEAVVEHHRGCLPERSQQKAGEQLKEQLKDCGKVHLILYV